MSPGAAAPRRSTACAKFIYSFSLGRGSRAQEVQAVPHLHGMAATGVDLYGLMQEVGIQCIMHDVGALCALHEGTAICRRPDERCWTTGRAQKGSGIDRHSPCVEAVLAFG